MNEQIGKLYLDFYPELTRLAYRMLKNRHDTEDVVHEVFIHALLESTVTPQNMEGWLRCITKNACITAIRARKPEVVLEGRSPDKDLLDQLERKELREQALSALNSLPRQQREAVWLHYVEGMKHKVVSKKLKCKVGTAMSRTHYGLRAVRQKLSIAS